MRFFLLLWCLSLPLQAQVLTRNAQGDFQLTQETFKVLQLAQDYARLLNLNLMVAPDVRDEEVVAVGPRVIAQGQMSNYLSVLLLQIGATLLRESPQGLVKVVVARDVRYSTLPVYRDLAQVPRDYNYVQFLYETKHVSSSELARNLRPFVSRYGRAIDIPRSQAFHLSDTGIGVHRLMEVIRLIDTPVFVERVAAVEKINQAYEKKVGASKGLWQIILDQHGLFLVIFLLLGLIIGFGARGYAIKRIEGGW